MTPIYLPKPILSSGDIGLIGLAVMVFIVFVIRVRLLHPSRAKI